MQKIAVAKYIVVPELWPKELKYRLSEFRMAYAMKGRVEALFSSKTYENFSEGFSDSCMSSVINSTLSLKPQTICRLNTKCEQFVENLDKGSGYMLTHKLLLLQLARARKCKMHPKILVTAIKKVCTTIYTETISVEYFVGLDEIFDLFLEQSRIFKLIEFALLCGYEGFADFLKIKWLEKIFQIQHSSGCFPVTVKKRRKRETNLWKDGCADHTTGLGAAVFSLYLNYVLKNAETITLSSEWV
ncbi:UPF0764 protein C16orf89 -like [Asbolus verrucosus]|uniref:UPF0764 protein C16orf89-like n=1 Tax=Asbolus verrucosus TaxID=1661398 RepID=A0A482VZ81_ASBVE|nr:UPF0764 protein C16orf89 -like [Asbolus verrucosus]